MKLYQDSGYVNMGAIFDLGLPFNFVVGGRGTGKTYTALKECVERNEVFFFLRRTQAQTDLVSKPEFSPFKKLNSDLGWNIKTAPISKNNAAFFKADADGQMTGSPIGYTGALSTMANIRGFDSSEVVRILYDEFIPELHEKPIKNEGAAFLNAYETINRNRELQGQKPVQVVCMANANTMSNALFLELGLVRVADKMLRDGREIFIDKKRGIGIFSLNKSPISDRKSHTVLYNLTSGSDFEKMAIKNDFSERSYRNVRNYPLAEFSPVVFVGEIAIYRHKSKNFLYVSAHRTGTAPEYGSSEKELIRFRRNYGFIFDALYRGEIVYQEIFCEMLLTKYIS